MFICSLCLMLLVSMTANAGIRKWDFTQWSQATIDNLKAEAAAYGKGDLSDVTYPATTLWRTYEKAAGTNEQDGKCYWYGTANPVGNIAANGVEIEELKGLEFSPMGAGSLAIAIDYPATGLGTYNGGAYLWIGGSNNVLKIPAVKPGSTITMYVEPHKITDGRGVGLTVNGTAVAPIEGTEKPTTLTKCVWVVPTEGIETETVDAVFTNNSGCHIYNIEVDETLYAGVKMTWIDYNNPDTANGEIAAGETARAGYNKISGGSVENANAGWNENKITYIKVDASAYPGTISKATLTADVSGSSDGKRTTTWGVGYNSSEWSADLTWNTADRTITTVGETQSTSTKSSTTFESKSFDITEALSNDPDKVVTLLVYETAAAGGYIKNPQVTIEYSLGTIVKYTINYLDATGNVLKDAIVSEALVGKEVSATAEHLAAFKNEAGDKKYIYVSGNDPIVIDADESKNVINLVFREAAIWNYTVVAKDADGNVLNEAAVKGTNFEGETFNLGYPRYALSNGQLYEAGKLSADKKGYYMSTTLDQDNYVLNVSYAKKEADSTVVYYEEAENFNSYSIGLLTTANAGIRASAGKAAYAKYDISLTSLKAGKYEIVAGLFDAAKTATYVADFAINGDTVATLAATAVNLSEVSAEINIAANNTRLSWLKSGNENKGLDYVYIKRLGDEDYTEVASIADVKKEKTGTPVALKLTDVKLTYSTKDSTCTNRYGYGYMEDATDGIGLDYSALDSLGWQSGNILNGTLYAIAKTDYYGRPVLTLAGKTPKSDVTLTPAENTPAEATVAQLSNTLWQKNYGKLFVLKDVKWGKAKINDYTTNYYLISGEDSIRFKDDMYVLPENMPAYEKFNSIQGYVNIGYDGDVVFNCNGVYDAVITPATRVANIAALKDIESDTDVLLNLDNAIVTVMQTGHSGNLIILEDKTGGIQMSAGNYYGEGGLANALGIDNDSTSITGDLYCRYTNSYGTIMISENDSTAASNVTVKTGVAVNPTVVTLADITTGNYDMRLVKIKNLGMTYDAEMYQAYLVSGETSVAVYDMFGTMMDENWQTIIVENLKSITGITIPATDYQPCSFAPLSYVEKKYKTFTENTVMLMTADNVAAAIAEGWAEGGATRVDNKKGNVDPATGAPLESPKAFEGVGLKSGNSAKTFAVDVTGIEQVIGYGASTSNKDTRTLKITATDADATTVSAEGTTAPNTTAVVKLDLDKTKAYTIEFTGLNADSSAGADIALHGIKFVYDSIALGISEVNTQSPNLGNIYNLNGMMVRKAGESLQGLEKGIYIINNKKVVVK